MFRRSPSKSGDHDDENSVEPSPDVHFEPLVSLPEVRMGKKQNSSALAMELCLFCTNPNMILEAKCDFNIYVRYLCTFVYFVLILSKPRPNFSIIKTIFPGMGIPVTPYYLYHGDPSIDKRASYN